MLSMMIRMLTTEWLENSQTSLLIRSYFSLDLPGTGPEATLTNQHAPADAQGPFGGEAP